MKRKFYKPWAFNWSGECFTSVSRTLQNIFSKFVYCRNHTFYENFKLNHWLCAQSHALGTRTKFQLEILTINMISGTVWQDYFGKLMKCYWHNPLPHPPCNRTKWTCITNQCVVWNPYRQWLTKCGQAFYWSHSNKMLTVHIKLFLLFYLPLGPFFSCTYRD